jgi:uncharacterized protein
MTLLAGLALALLIGVTLGLLGGGGSILTVPVFVYVMGVEPKAAIAMSLPVVGITSLLAAWGHWRRGTLHLRTALTFGSVAMLAAWASARFVARHVPGTVQLALLGVVMLAAAISMLRRQPARQDAAAPATGSPRGQALLAVGAATGALTGLVGIGGGFLFVPALVVLGRLPVHMAVGTSLLVIAMNTAAAAVDYVGHIGVDWRLVGAFTALAILGSVAGARIGRRTSPAALRRGFAYFLLAMAGFILNENRNVLRDPAGAMRPAAAHQPR